MISIISCSSSYNDMNGIDNNLNKIITEINKQQCYNEKKVCEIGNYIFYDFINIVIIHKNREQIIIFNNKIIQYSLLNKYLKTFIYNNNIDENSNDYKSIVNQNNQIENMIDDLADLL